METVRPFEHIPYIPLPGNYPMNLGTFLVSMYEQYGPVFRTTYLGKNLVYLVGPEANRFILMSDRRKFSYHDGWGQLYGVVDVYGEGLLTMDGVEYEQHRRMMNPAFAISYMDRYLPLMNRIIRRSIEAWATMDEVDVYQEVRKITFDIAAEALMGLKSGREADRFREMFVHLLMQGMRARRSRLKDEVSHLLQLKIQERRVHPADDVLGLLVQARDNQGNALSDEQIIAHINILLVAGHETSTSLGTWLLYLLSQHPRYTQRVLAEQNALLNGHSEPPMKAIKQMKVLENALNEAERLYPPIAVGPRGVLEDFVFNGYYIPAGTYVGYAIAATHLLPSIFAEPTLFDPDRFAPPREEHKKVPFALVGFGGGPRICIGINFAKTEIKMMVAHILRHYDLDLVPSQEIIQFYRATGMPLHGIKMYVRARKCSHAYSGVAASQHAEPGLER
ncbi:MAG TPA: cytochrome P450 [Ktedonobacteraceae bacterium]|nr:cytochrome P450 [Ktedonobacteraceae bacterium]